MTYNSFGIMPLLQLGYPELYRFRRTRCITLPSCDRNLPGHEAGRHAGAPDAVLRPTADNASSGRGLIPPRPGRCSRGGGYSVNQRGGRWGTAIALGLPDLSSSM